VIPELVEDRQPVHTSSSKVYQRKVPGQTTGSEAIGLLNRDSNAGYPENIPSQVVRAMSSERHYA
jgi:hypothetical protein